MPSIACPKCKTTMAYVPELAGKPVACPACGQKFRSPTINAAARAPTPPAPPAAAPAPAPAPAAPVAAPVSAKAPELSAPPSFQFSVATKPAAPAPRAPTPPAAEPSFLRDTGSSPSLSTSSSGSAAFRPREYPALRIIIIVLYCLAGLVVLQFLLLLLFLLVGAFGGAYVALGSGQSSSASLAGLIGMLISFVILLVSHGMLVILFTGSAESIRLWIDIQRNTQETAHFTRYPVVGG